MLSLIIAITIFIKFIAKYIKNKSKNQYPKYNVTVGFFHPFCNSGGGGERVLWSAIKVVQDKYPNVMCLVYTGDADCKAETVVDKVNQRFDIKMDAERLDFIHLRTRFLVLDKYYPVFTLLGQSLGSVVVAIEAMFKFIPTIFFETTGYAFTYPIFHYLAGVPVGCYVHYPTISVDMLKNVSERNFAFNNRYIISKSKILTNGKLMYYKIFAKLYSFCGRCSDCIMVNSTWTLDHINSLWSVSQRTAIVYPPCDVEKFLLVNNEKRDDNFYISSVAQFRPEKNQQLQLRSFADFLKRVDPSQHNKIKLIVVGSCRNAEDEGRVNDLKKLSNELQIEKNVEFKLNISFDDLQQVLGETAVGLHSMKEEHFGIGVVECMAAGTLMLAHNSGGPKSDIVVPYNGEQTGYLAATLDEYSESLMNIYNLTSDERNKIRQEARKHVQKFGQNEFNVNFMEFFNKYCFSSLVNQ